MPASDGVVSRTYDNGFVNIDAPRADELNADGSQFSSPGGRYTTTSTDAVGNVSLTGNFLSFTTGLSRKWSYGAPSQAVVRPGYIALSSYSATSDGGALDKKQGPTGGMEMQFARTLGRLSKRTEWRLLTGIALNGINNKIGADTLATLRTNTNFYSLNGQAAPATSPATPYTGPSFGDLTDVAGNVLIASGSETTTPIAATPDDTLSTSTAVTGGTTVHGNYQVRGAYFFVKLGPSIRTQLTERLGLSASLGLAGAYAGSRYSAVESFEIPEIGSTRSTTEQSNASKFLRGYYADFNVEWFANERTGLFGGISAQKFDEYDQTVGGRTAHIDLGSSVGIRGGITVKF